jgi:hypothetical protein
MSLAPSRLEILVIARAATNVSSSTRPLSPADIAKALRRFAPTDHTDAEWYAEVQRAFDGLRSAGILDDAGRLLDKSALSSRIGKHSARSWIQLADRVLPAVALGLRPDDKAVSKLKDRDAWTAAIAARLLGMWHDGPPPSLSTVCDAYVWRALALAGRPKRCPPEVRAVFLQRELDVGSGPPDKLLRLYVGRAIGAPRSELRVIRDALVRRWLLGRALTAHDEPARAEENTDEKPDEKPDEKDATPSPEPAAIAAPAAFAREVMSAARSAREGLFGDRKVFISSVWDDLRRKPSWSSLTLDEFKARLVRAHRAGDIVLARADFVSGMNPEVVAASEIQTDGASFHFIVREDSR